MAQPASPDDLRRLIKHRRDEAAITVGKEAAQIQSEASAHGALGSGRLGLLYIEAAERAWRALVNASIEDLRSYAHQTDLPADLLVPVLREELGQGLTQLREASKFDAPAGRGYQSSPAAMKRYEAAWSKLPPFLDLKLRQFELGVDRTEQRPPSITYSITAESITGPIQQGSHHSTQAVAVSGDTLLTKLESTIQTEIGEPEVQKELLALVKGLQETQGTPEFLGLYQRFMSSAANHMTVFAPFLPALAQLIRI